MKKISIENNLDGAINWCMKHLGRRWSMYPNWPRDGALFIFDQEQDASWFALHWA